MPRNRYYRGPVTDHFDGTRFHGPGPTVDKSRRDLARLYRTPFAAWPTHVENLPATPLIARLDGSRLRVTSIGHASHLIQSGGLNILVDPVWSERASPLSFLGPKRVAPPGLALSTLPPIDVVLITHNHYDHLDLASLAALHARWGCRIVVPLGNDTIIRRRHRALNVTAHDWDDRVRLNEDVVATLLPCHHWSARGLSDRRMALWAAYMIETPHGNVYYLGDTAYRDGAIFREVPQRFGRPRVAIIPIGAYAPRWFMRDHHVSPEESVAIFQDCETDYALAHHWGTFCLTAEPIDEPPQRLQAALAGAGIRTDRFRVQRPGQAFDVP